MDEIIEVVSIQGKRDTLEVIEDIGGPEEISVGSIEIVPVIRGKDDRSSFSCFDIRDYMKKGDMNLGLRHAECLLKVQWKIPKEWEDKRLFFPGTIFRGARSEKLYFLFLYEMDRVWEIDFNLFIRREWIQKKDWFVRWRR